MQLLQVRGLGAIHIDHRALNIGLGSARSSGEVLLGDGLSGGGGSHDGMWVTQLGKVKSRRIMLCKKSTRQKTARCLEGKKMMGRKKELRCRRIDAGGSRPNPVSGPHRIHPRLRTFTRGFSLSLSLFAFPGYHNHSVRLYAIIKTSLETCIRHATKCVPHFHVSETKRIASLIPGTCAGFSRSKNTVRCTALG